MKPITLHPSHYHTWRDVGGPIGWVLDVIFCSLVLVAGLGMIVVAVLILLVDYVASPVLALLSRLRAHLPR